MILRFWWTTLKPANFYGNDLDTKFWKAADKLRANMDAASTNMWYWGLSFWSIFSDAFDAARRNWKDCLKTSSTRTTFTRCRDDYDTEEAYQQAIAEELEVQDYYTEKNVFWVPKLARWETLKTNAALPVGTVLGKTIAARPSSWRQSTDWYRSGYYRKQ